MSGKQKYRGFAMNTWMRFGCLGLVLAVLAAGCAKSEDKLVNEQLAILTKMAESYETVTDKDSYGQIQPEQNDLGQKLAKNREEIAALSEARRDAALASHEAELKEAFDRVSKGKRSAIEKANGLRPRK